MKPCYIVVHRNYSEGTDAYAFWSKDDAMKSINEDVETVVKSLTEEGYEPTVLRDACDGVEVYVADSDIYYQWSIFDSNVQGGGKVKYRVRISELRYGEVEVEAENEEQAKTIASGKEIEWFDSETTDMTAERID